jgi:hypothetical protein
MRSMSAGSSRAGARVTRRSECSAFSKPRSNPTLRFSRAERKHSTYIAKKPLKKLAIEASAASACSARHN